MTDFKDLNNLLDILLQFWFGSQAALALFILFFFNGALINAGIDIRYSIAFSLPLVAFFAAIGWFATIVNSVFVLNLFLIVVAFFYATAIIRFMS